ncbi:response regulator [Leptolyngbya sp. NK1-12]|uniref:Response regulator n=1 Tax=Leptolyngbya sp. NK1-12 TaxID=2547451 RepID=A0AA96WPY7_9CYAN|nr:response regulator [Leptolyngbya sp. NK1-12]
MSSEQQFRQYIDTIRQQIASKSKLADHWEKLAAAVEELELTYEEMQTQLEAAEVIEERLVEQNQQICDKYQYFYNLFQFAPIPYLVTDANGLILEANQAIADLLHVPQPYLAGKPLVLYVAEADRSAFRSCLNRLSSSTPHSDAYNSDNSNNSNNSDSSDNPIWQITLRPRRGEPIRAEVTVVVNRDGTGSIQTLQIGVYTFSQSQPLAAPAVVSQPLAVAGVTAPSLPQALDGLQVLIVDDEADAREFITAVLESHGVRVTAVATAAAALEVLEHCRPDVLVSDIRMPDEDGYSLIRKVRALEAQTGWHISAAALTAYLAEDREKALTAGFEAHLHKLAQPTELIEMVARLAEQSRAEQSRAEQSRAEQSRE